MKSIFTIILILITILIYGQDNKINKGCDYARFEISFIDSLDNNTIDTAKQNRICKYLTDKIKYPNELFIDCIRGDFKVCFKLKVNGNGVVVDTSQLRIFKSIDKRIDNQVVDLFKQMPGFYLDNQLHSMRYEQTPSVKLEEKEFCIGFRCIVTGPKPKKNLEAKVMKVDKN